MRYGFAALALALAACGPDPVGAEFDTEGWIDTMPPGPPDEGPVGDGDDEDDEGEEGGELEAYWGIWGEYANGEFGEMGGEFFAEQYGQELCLIEFYIALQGEAAGCDACSSAWEFRADDSFAEIDVKCDEVGPGDVEGMTFKLGIADDGIVHRDEGDGFKPIGEWFEEDGELILEWEDGVEEFEP